MQAEFLVIHSMAFLGLIALWQPADEAGKRWRTGLFWGLFALYCAMALSAGVTQLAVFFALTFVTYLGLFLNWRSPSAQLQLGVRWLAGFALFITALEIFDPPRDASDWGGRSSVLRAGALYFFALAAVEASGFFLRTIPRHSRRLLAVLAQARQRGS